jgi:Ribonuclease toxin, BrnT, of type II toxin-antitoxin system
MDARSNLVYKYAQDEMVLEFEWDPNKAASNLRKHGVRFAEAVAVLEDHAALSMPDDDSHEERFVSPRHGLAWENSRGNLRSSRR